MVAQPAPDVRIPFLTCGFALDAAGHRRQRPMRVCPARTGWGRAAVGLCAEYVLKFPPCPATHGVPWQGAARVPRSPA